MTAEYLSQRAEQHARLLASPDEDYMKPLVCTYYPALSIRRCIFVNRV